MKCYIDRDETLCYLLSPKKGYKTPSINLTRAEIREWKKVENAYFKWQSRLEDEYRKQIYPEH